MNPPMRCLHTNIKFATLGGVQSILRAHHQFDEAYGLDSRFLVYLEPPDPRWTRARCVNFTWAWTLGRTRRRIERLLADFTPDIAVYHTTLAMPYLADLDRSPRRVLYLHSPLSVLQEQLTSRLHWVDGVIGVSDELLNLVHSMDPRFGPDRLHRVRAPIFPPALPVDLQRPAGGPLVLGYCGRLQTLDKRVDRIPELCRALESQGISYRFEILGDGPERAMLERALPDRSRVIFHGSQSGDRYWTTLAGWDAIVFVSDREGLPLAQLEAMHLGVIPVVPAVQSGADAYARQLDAHLVYPIGDVTALAAAIRFVLDHPDQRPAWRARCQELVKPHNCDAYFQGFSGFLESIRSRPPVPRQPFPARPFPSNLLPLAAMLPLAQLRRALRSLRLSAR